MGAQLLASKVVIVEEEPRVRSVPALPTAVLGAARSSDVRPSITSLVPCFARLQGEGGLHHLISRLFNRTLRLEGREERSEYLERLGRVLARSEWRLRKKARSVPTPPRT